jgi:ribonuclease R
LVGRLYREGNIVQVEVENTRINQQILVDSEDTENAEHGQYVVVEILHQPTKRTHATGRVIEILGDHMAPGMEIDVAIRTYGVPFEWPKALELEVSKLQPIVSESDKNHRIDIRHLPLVTIDGEDARDFDDAVYCKKQGSGWTLYVAIADVSHYVQPDSALDLEAHNRGTSVYFPDHVVPMLPEVLSNGLCSLNPKVDRLCMVCEMDISAEGRVTASRFYEGVMYSHARLTYNQVGAMLETPDSPDGIQLCEDFADVLPELHNLYSLFDALTERRKERGAIEFDTVETRIIFGEERKIEAIVPTVRNDAHKIIEECMLCANVATAEFLSRHKIPALYRIHETPSAVKLENVRSFLGEQGLQLMGGEEPKPADYQEVIRQIKGRPDFSVLQTILLRSMSQAVYGPEEKGHFGLAYDHYAHFTSPIRRYPDLLVHRAIKSIIYSEKSCDDVLRPDDLDLSKYTYHYDLPKMLVLGEHCSMTERRADEATRDVNSWLKCEYLQQHLGEVFEGIISGVTGFGFFVELADLYVEGLVHVSALTSDYYHYDGAKHRMIGERSGVSYSLGDAVVVEVAKINLEERKVDLLLVSAEPKKRTRRRSEKKGAAKGKKVEKKGVKASDKTAATPNKAKRKPKAAKPKTSPSKATEKPVAKKKATQKTQKTPESEKTGSVRKRKVKAS